MSRLTVRQPLRTTLVHGILTDGRGNVDLFKTLLERAGFWPDDPWFPRRNFIEARWSWRTDARRLYAETDQGGDILAHSYGCLVALKAAERRRFRQIWLFGPALSKHYDLTKLAGEPTVHCVWSPDDDAIKWGARQILHPFGLAGREGMTDPGVINHESSGNHADAYFAPVNLERFFDAYQSEHERLCALPDPVPGWVC